MKPRLDLDFEWQGNDLLMDGLKIVQTNNHTPDFVYVYSIYPGLQSHSTSPRVVHRNVVMDVISCMLVRLS